LLTCKGLFYAKLEDTEAAERMFKKGARLIKHPEEITLVVPTQNAVSFLNLDLYQARGMNNYRRAYEKDNYAERDNIMDKALEGTISSPPCSSLLPLSSFSPYSLPPFPLLPPSYLPLQT
jgi:hypothetical protein